MGVPCIVSDIAVNKEIPRSERIYFFDVNSKEDLVKKMRIIIQKKHRKIPNQNLQRIKIHNMKKYADYLYTVIDKVMSES